MRLVLVVIFTTLLAGISQAHDLWLEKEDRGVGLYYGHKRSTHEGEAHLEYDPGWIRSAFCFDAAGRATRLGKGEGYPYRIREECAVSYVLVSSGYWTKTPYGTKNVPKTEARMPLKSWLSYESVKRVDGWTPALAKPLTGEFEMTPLEDPLSLSKGKKLRLQVSFDSQPVEGVVVTYDGKPRGQTGEDGRINIRVRRGGFQVIQASLQRPYTAEEADEVIHSTNLNFELPED